MNTPDEGTDLGQPFAAPCALADPGALPVNLQRPTNLVGIEVAQAFFNQIWPEAPERGCLGIGTKYTARWFKLDPAGKRESAEYALTLSEREDVYFHTCAHDPTKAIKRGRKLSATFAHALWLDLDFKKPGSTSNYPTAKQALRALSSLRIPPSMLVASGRGLHCYWALADAILATEAEDLCYQLREYILGVLPVGSSIDRKFDAASILRVPGTRNHKWGVPVRVWYPKWQADSSLRRYQAFDIADHFVELGLPTRTPRLQTASEEVVAVHRASVALFRWEEESLDQYVRKAIWQTTPQGPGKRHESLLRFMVILKGHPDLANTSASYSLKYAKQWHQAVRSRIGTKSWVATEADFKSGWPRIRWPKGCQLRRALQNATMSVDPRVAAYCMAHNLRSKRMPFVISLCIAFAGEGDGKNFFLSSYLLAAVTGITQPIAWRYLSKLEHEGLLTKTEPGTKGRAGRANRYCLNAAALENKTPAGEESCLKLTNA